jgi:hypothetical protein
MKKKKILIIGFGKIGFNHFKAAKKLLPNVEIYIFDKKKIGNELLRNKNIKLLSDLRAKLIFDLVIISTNSEERYDLFLKLVKYNDIKNIIFEKFVFYKKEQFKKTLKILHKKKIKAWVNCLRREINIFKFLKNKITGQFKLIYQYSEWGLGCNTIHFLDLFGFLLKTNKIKVSHSNLDNKIYKSKREGYLEFKGSLEFTFNNSILSINDNKIFKKKIFKIITKNKIFSFNKRENILTEKNLNNNYIKKYRCEEPKVSLVSFKTINKIIKNKKTNLPSLKESFFYHNLLIDTFSKHLKKNNMKKNLKIT